MRNLRFALRAKELLVTVLLSLVAANIRADDQPNQAAIFFSGPTGIYDSPSEAFSAYQEWLTEQSLTFTVSDLAPCSAGEIGTDYTINGIDGYYCWTHDNGVDQERKGLISANPVCPAEKPTLFWINHSPSAPPNVSDVIAACTGSAGGALPAPTPPDLCANSCGNPVQVETHNKIERAKDIALDGLLSFTRTYTSSTGEWRHTFSDRVCRAKYALNGVWSIFSLNLCAAFLGKSAHSLSHQFILMRQEYGHSIGY